MNEEDAREYSESLAQIGEGWYKQIAWAFRLEIPAKLGMGRREWAEKYHGYLKLAIPERREAVAELAANGHSQREIADALGVDQKTVNRDLNPEANASPPEAEAPVDRPSDANPEANASPPEAESTEDRRRKRIQAWAEALRDALRRIDRMVGYPIPDELAEELGPDDTARLEWMIKQLEGEESGVRA